MPNDHAPSPILPIQRKKKKHLNLPLYQTAKQLTENPKTDYSIGPVFSDFVTVSQKIN